MTQVGSAPHVTPYRVILAGICALVLTVGLARFAYTPMLPIMKAQAGLGYVAAGWLAAINYAGYMAGTLLAATAGTLHTRYVLYRIGLVVAVASTVAMGLTRDPVAWGVLRFLSGLSSVAGLLLASGLVLNWLLQHGRRPDLGLHFTGMGLGIVVSGAAVVLTLPALAWSGQWIALGVLGLAFFVPAWCWMPAPASPPAAANPQASPSAAASGAWMRLLSAAYLCAGFGFVIGATFIVAILETLPVLQGRGGWVWVIVGVAALPSTFVWDRIARRSGATRALAAAYVLQGVGMLLPAVSSSAAVNLLSAALFGSTFVGIVSLTLALVGRHAPSNPSKGMARITLGYGVAQIIGPIIAGYMAKATGTYQGALVATALLMGCGALLLYVADRQERR
ncbi:MFS transporter [Stenotrophomonas sp. ESTM1D_MKCIP4_1]|uniref:YbfB/YjiJ family MFS transporter n=1 Tax=Stenotrophomonas sp. ESTM1D_MKCIP4_1 TaxID=2072414 RepID=UPI000D53F46E|nr:YbfB/YjiJ family MFS transporter [Stenotrophomonas sp. ESTM1D_MKCIP4_1]AWH53544.1 MFS transporter [Stenotrophomonas sp. ESTM1D_MKCIP4_1]